MRSIATQVPIARRIAEHVALAVSHQQLAEAVSRAAEAQARAEQLEARVRSLSEELDSRSGYGRVIGRSDAWQAVLEGGDAGGLDRHDGAARPASPAPARK